MKLKQLPQSQLDEIMMAGAAWKKLKVQNPDAINTTVGIVLDPKTQSPWRPQAVQRAMSQALDRINVDNDYGLQSQVGHEGFLSTASEKIFTTTPDDMLAFQTTGGTRALSLARDVIYEISDVPNKISLMAEADWPNYHNIFKRDYDISVYDHQDYENGTYRHDGCVEAIDKLDEGSVVLLQVSGHNNDGLDRTKQQWDELVELCESKQHIVILDSAYMGLSGTFEEDSYPFRRFAQSDILTFGCFSTSKIMGLYGERLGALFILNSHTLLGDEQSEALAIVVKKLIRGTESSNSRLLAETGQMTLQDGTFLKELEETRTRIQKSRKILVEIIGKNFPQIATGGGLFTKLLPSGFSEQQVTDLATAGVHVLPSSRINLAGFDEEQATVVAKALADVL